MQKIQEFLNMIKSPDHAREYENYFKKENVVKTAKKVYDAIDSLDKMPENDAMASVLLANRWLENKNK